MSTSLVPPAEMTTIRTQFPGASTFEISRLWDEALCVVAEWICWDCHYSMNDTHPNMQAARLFYVLYALTPLHARRKREAYRLSAMQIMLPRWNLASRNKGK